MNSWKFVCRKLHADPYTHDRDLVCGNGGKDKLNVRDGDTNDLVAGRPGRDLGIVDSGAEVGVGYERVRGD
jgi:hypothetical protein